MRFGAVGDGVRAQPGADEAGRDDTGPMGMDPTRPHRRRPSDLLYVGAGLLVVVALLVWALLG